MDAFLVFDVEATCVAGMGMNSPTEVIEWPVCLMRYNNLAGQPRSLQVVAEFHSFVRPTWRPVLSEYCTDLTGITQAQVNSAPLFPEVLQSCEQFLAQHGLINPTTGEALQRFCWCTDGPWDFCDFVVKQCFISNISMPKWLKGNFVDVRKTVTNWAASQSRRIQLTMARHHNIGSQLRALSLPPFQGRMHNGMDDTRNIARIVAELSRRGIPLVPNTTINPDRRWAWMGRRGKVIMLPWLRRLYSQ